MCPFQLTWAVIAAVMLVLLMLGGCWIVGRPLGILVNSQNKMSLEHLQVVLWTWLMISAFLAVAINSKTMNIEVPNELLALMGISIGSVAGSVIVNGTKVTQQPASSVPANVQGVLRQGLLPMNAAPAGAELSDLFRGEELTNNSYIDISKVQMFFFTIAMVIGYAMLLARCTFDAPDGLIKFPEFSASAVALLGISHAGFLTIKAAPKTPTSPNPAA
jgi:hypothetical protein